MKAPSVNLNQGFLLSGDLLEAINPQNPLMRLGQKIPWDFLESELAPRYADDGSPAKPVRLMCGLLILKQLENLSDEHLMEQWIQKPLFPSFLRRTCFPVESALRVFGLKSLS